MGFPSNGSVVIVDDEIEKEALPLIQALSKRGISVRFFNGRASTLPEHPVGEVRLLFLDLKLEGMDFSMDPDNTAQALKGVIERIVGPDNGPYIILGWTKTPHHLHAVINTLSKKPVLVLDMQKSECISDGACEFKKIEQKLNSKLTEIGTYRLLFDWENLVKDSAARLVNEMFQATTGDMPLETILYKIAEANWGEENIKRAKSNRRTKAALHVFNYLLSDSIDKKVDNFGFLGLRKPVSNIALDSEFISKLNSKLLLSQQPDKKPYPGSVYVEFNRVRNKACKNLLEKRIDDNKVRKHLKPSVEKENEQLLSSLNRTKRATKTEELIGKAADRFEKRMLEESKSIFVEITPVCDYAQSQAKHHRIIPGILIKQEYSSFLNIGQTEIAFYKSPPVYIDSFAASFFFLFDFRGFETIRIDSLNSKRPLVRLRQEMLFDMQHKAGSHFSRPGTISLRDETKQ